MRSKTRQRIMHPVDVDVEVIIAEAWLRKVFPGVEYPEYGGPIRMNDIRRGIVEGWRWCSDKGEHTYEVSVKADANRPDLFTVDEIAYGYKIIEVPQKAIVSTS